MSYTKEQFIADFKNAYNQTQQLHFLYKYLREYEGQIASVDVDLESEDDAIAYYQFIFELDNGDRIESNSIAFASYTFVTELDTRVTSNENNIDGLANRVTHTENNISTINRNINSLTTRITDNENDIADIYDRCTNFNNRISNNEGDIVDINDKMLTLPDTTPTTRKVVTIDTNGAQDNVDGTELTTLMDNIVDSNGNKRFVEGDLAINAIEGVTMTYGKWSLSGTHLMIVLALELAEGAILALSTGICHINLPQWILDKVVPLSGTYISISKFKTFGSGTDTEINIELRKIANRLTIYSNAQYTSARNERVRIQFDLLIDSE